MFTDDVVTAAEWDTWNWSRAIRFWLTNGAVTLANARCLEIGGRHGNLARFFASHGASVLCIDKFADASHDLSFPAPGGVAFAHCDLFELPDNLDCDLVIFKSVLGALGRYEGYHGQRLAMEMMRQALRAGGELWFAENLSASPLHRLMRREFISRPRSWRYPAIGEFHDLLSGFSNYRFSTLGFFGTFGRTEFQRRCLGRVDSVLDRWLIPKEWHYIVTGVCQASG